jgi:hydroxyethylthiazole kinase
MSDDKADAADLAAIASALVVNIGTISEAQEIVMDSAIERAKFKGIPIILDPVGAGATPRRLTAANKFSSKASVIRGNASEILALCGASPGQKGVDSIAASNFEVMVEKAKILAASLGVVVAVTGPTDIVTDGNETMKIEGGHELMTKLTGTGCLLTAITGAYVAASPDNPLAATAAALWHLALAGERAHLGLKGSDKSLGAYKTLLFDQIAQITPRDLA